MALSRVAIPSGSSTVCRGPKPFLTVSCKRPLALPHAPTVGLLSSSSSPPTVTKRSLRCGALSIESPLDEPKMFCYQCEQTSHGDGCTEMGICGKTPEVAALQDLLIYELKGLCTWSCYIREAAGVEIDSLNTFVLAAAFSTMTNVNFDDERFRDQLLKAAQFRRDLVAIAEERGLPGPKIATREEVPWLYNGLPHPATLDLLTHLEQQSGSAIGELVDLGHLVAIYQRWDRMGNETVIGLQELLTYGIKGMAAYALHGQRLGKKSLEVSAFVQEVFAFLATPAASEAEKVLEYCMRTGEVNFTVMQLLSEGHSETFGDPSPAQVALRPRPGPAILVSGHDMHDLHVLLEQTEDMGINIYTHGEMLPAHSYPKLRAYPHLAGHFGGAWYRQKTEFSNWPGSILMTTNCVLEPLRSYRENLFTTGEVGVAGVEHVEEAGEDFSAVIARALHLPGYTQEECDAIPDKHFTVGFGHKAILGVADQVLDAVATEKLRHIFLVGGCDGSEPQRRYYDKLAQKMPSDTLILTLGCGKYRILGQDFGNLPGTGLPRLLDMGQCNDAYSAIVVAQELANALQTDINSLPLSLDLSWFEQKAVAVLLTLLHLGVKNIRLGPRMPAFLTPEATQILVDAFNLIPADIKDPESDVNRMLHMA